MPLPASGQISFSDLNTELNAPSNAQRSLGDSSVRAMVGITTGNISIIDSYNKTGFVSWTKDAISTNNDNIARFLGIASSGNVYSISCSDSTGASNRQRILTGSNLAAMSQSAQSIVFTSLGSMWYFSGPKTFVTYTFTATPVSIYDLRLSVDFGVTFQSFAQSLGSFNDILHNGTLYVVLGYSSGANQAIYTTPNRTTNWTSTATTFPQQAQAFTFAGGLYVVVGNAGMVQTSAGLTGFVARTSNTANQLNDVEYNGSSLYVAVGNAGTIITSPDGITAWTVRTSGTTQNLTAITYGNGKFVVGGNNGVVLSSTDGINWTLSNIPFNEPARSVFWDGERYILQNTQGIFSSQDAIGWSLVLSCKEPLLGKPAYSPTLDRFVFGTNGNFPATRYSIAYSSDSITWTYFDSGPDTVQYPHWFGNKFIAGGFHPNVKTSTNGITWTEETATGQSTSQRLGPFASNSSHIVAAGYNVNPGSIMISTNGTTWTNTARPTFSQINSLVYTNSLFLGVTNGGNVISSSNATIWNRVQITDSNLNDITWTGTQYIAVASANTNVWVSTNLVTWTRQQVGTAGTTNGFYGVASINGTAVIVGINSAVYTSPNGTTWTQQTVPGPTQALTSIIAVPGKPAVITGFNGAILTNIV